MKKVELLAPAGDVEKLKMAILYGADAVFIGGTSFSLRSRASNFTLEDIKESCDFAHIHDARVHVTCNIVMHNSDLANIKEYLLALEACGVDAIICSSITIMKLVKELTKMEVHVSTQTSTLNSKAVKYYEKLKVDRVVLGRELSIKEIGLLRENTNTDLEVFIHGGMCVSYSGRCMLSNNMTNRDANRGGCAHSCRWNYNIYSKDTKLNKDNEFFAMSSKDLCSIHQIPDLIDIGVNSFKIEGRMKSLHYIAMVVKTYRMLIDEYYSTHQIKDFSIYENMINKAENRQTSTGFLKGLPTIQEQLYDLNKEIPTKEFVGLVLAYDKETKLATIEQRNYFLPFTSLLVVGPKREFVLDVKEIFDKNLVALDAARHPLEIIKLYSEVELFPNEMLRLMK